LLAPAASQEEYFQKVLGAALGVGLEDYEVLRGLLWHSPQGDFKSRSEGLAYLHEVVSNSTQIKDSKLNQRSFMEELESRVNSDQIGVVSRVSLPRDNRPQVFLKPLPPNGPGAGPSSWPELKEPEEAVLRETQASDDKDYPTFLEDPSLRESTLLDRTHYEGLLHELGKLTNVVDELKHHMVGREGALEPESGKAHKRLGEAGESLSPDLPGKRAKAMNHQDDMDQPTEEQAQLRDFMEQNPDLASDPRKVQIVEYCLKNYININRELAGLPIRAKLEKAGEIARNFLKGRQ